MPCGYRENNIRLVFCRWGSLEVWRGSNSNCLRTAHAAAAAVPRPASSVVLRIHTSIRLETTDNKFPLVCCLLLYFLESKRIIMIGRRGILSRWLRCCCSRTEGTWEFQLQTRQKSCSQCADKVSEAMPFHVVSCRVYSSKEHTEKPNWIVLLMQRNVLLFISLGVALLFVIRVIRNGRRNSSSSIISNKTENHIIIIIAQRRAASSSTSTSSSYTSC